MSFPSSLPFYALLKYSPRGTSTLSRQSRDLCYGLKNDAFNYAAKRPYVDQYAEAIKQHYPKLTAIHPCFGPAVQLVPVPRSAPRNEGDFWPTRRISQALVAQGIASGVSPLVERHTRVTRSATAGSNRPGPEDHYQTLKVVPPLLPVAEQLTIVDDVVTRGATLLALYRLLNEVYPQTTIRCFAMVRTDSFVEDIDKIGDPVSGTIEYDPFFKSLHRTP